MIIQSLFDDDLYKFTMQQAVLKLYPEAKAKYFFKNRGPHRFSNICLSNIAEEVKKLCEMRATDDELNKLSKLPFIQPWYVDHLRNYRYQRSEITHLGLNPEKELVIEINGPWHSTILWEVKLMAIISETYFKTDESDKWSMEKQKERR